MHYIYNIEPEAHCILVICDKVVEVIVQTENYVKFFDLSPNVHLYIYISGNVCIYMSEILLIQVKPSHLTFDPQLCRGIT